MNKVDEGQQIPRRHNPVALMIGLCAIALAVAVAPRPALRIGATAGGPTLALSIGNGAVRIAININ